MKFLTFAIPTFNRCDKLERLFTQLIKILNSSKYKDDITILVSNNASTDLTLELIQKYQIIFQDNNISFECVHQKSNIGFDRNVLFVYEYTKTEYMWLFSDDDILIEDAFDFLITDLKKFVPNVALSSFVQPPYGFEYEKRLFHYPENFVEKDITKGIKFIKFYQKTSIFVFKKELLEKKYKEILNSTIGYAYSQLALAMVLFLNFGQKVLIRSNVVAKADEEWADLRFRPSVWWNVDKVTYLSTNHHNSYEEKIKPILDLKFNIDYTLFLDFLIRHINGEIKIENSLFIDDLNLVLKHKEKILENKLNTCKYQKIRAYIVENLESFKLVSQNEEVPSEINIVQNDN